MNIKVQNPTISIGTETYDLMQFKSIYEADIPAHSPAYTIFFDEGDGHWCLGFDTRAERNKVYDEILQALGKGSQNAPKISER